MAPVLHPSNTDDVLSSQDRNSNIEPVVLQFSLFYPRLTSDNYEDFSRYIMKPIIELVLCSDGFVLIPNQNDDSLESDIVANLCLPFQEDDDFYDYPMENSTNVTTADFNGMAATTSMGPNDPNATILSEAAIFVKDRSFPKESLEWTSWTMYYHVDQVGQSIREMVMIGSGGYIFEDNTTLSEGTSDSFTFIADVKESNGGVQIHFDTLPSQQQLQNQEEKTPLDGAQQPQQGNLWMHRVINGVLQLSLQVNIMEKIMDAAVQQRLPGARFSLSGDENVTFLPFVSIDQNRTAKTSRVDSSTTAPSEIKNRVPNSVSLVAEAMYRKDTMRNLGLAILGCAIFFLAFLRYSANRRRCDGHSRQSLHESVPESVTMLRYKKRKKREISSFDKWRWNLKVVFGITLFFPFAASTTTYKVPRPNFVILLLDDLDWTLGGANASTLTRTRRYIAEEGKTFENWFVQTPVCCPSRAELLTGKIYHNLRLTSDTRNGCMHVNVTDDASHPFYSRDYFAPFFSRNKKLHYNVGVFGKHLNSYNPTKFMLPGVDEMLINNGGEYLDPTFTFGNGTDSSVKSIHFNTCLNATGTKCYSTSIIGNTSVSWIERQALRQRTSKHPFLALISVKAPHIKDAVGYSLAIPAPWYESSMIEEEFAPRTPNYNYSGSPDHHWVVRTQGVLTKEEGEHIDKLYVSRLKTLISVDDLVEDLILKLSELQVLNNTYIIFTSDNGYRLGQFRMPMCKLHPYENDIRVPMMIRGPGIAKNSTTNLVSTHVNLMPTLIGLATRNYHSQDVVPNTMDGLNLAAMIVDQIDINDVNKNASSEMIFESSSVLIEYTSLGDVVRYNHLVDTYNHSFAALRILHTDPAHYPFHNIKYIEFRDTRIDWNMVGPALERELYDLDHDPYEMHNLVNEVPSVLVEALSSKIQRMIQCRADGCRTEHTSGLDLGINLLLTLHSIFRRSLICC